MRLPTSLLLILIAPCLARADIDVGSAPSPIQRIGNGVELIVGPTKVRVVFESEQIVRVTKSLQSAPTLRPSLILIPRESTPLRITVAEEAVRVTVASPNLCANISKADGAITFSLPAGEELLSEGASTITACGAGGEPGAFSVETRFALSASEGIYGLGQHQDGFMNYRGHTVKLVQANTQSAVPFLVSTRGYGLLWDNYSKTIFNDTSTGCSVWSEVADAIDYHFIYGGSMDGAIAGYRELTGTAPLYGKWAYGYWQSKEHYENQAEVMNVAAEYRARGIPIDCIVQDWDYWPGREHWNQLFFDDKLFPKPAEMIDTLHRQNVHFMISVWCGFGPQTPVYQEMERRGFLYPPAGWAGFKFFDVYDPAATDLYWQYLNTGLFRYGVDAWWMDSTEPDIVNALTKESQEYEMKRTGTNHLGTFARYLNTYPLLATESVYRNQRYETDRKRVYILTRSTFAGQQRAAATTWSGDIGASWEIFRRQISAGLNHSMSGIPYWTFDIGGFVIGSYGGLFPGGGKDPAYQELYTRMFQFGAFCPIFRSHGSETPREIWEFGQFTPILVKYDRLRYRLMPYIYANAWRVTNEGYTLMRGLAMDFPQDCQTYGVADQFLFGPSLMACPVTDYQLHRPPEQSVPIPSEYFRTQDGHPGLEATYYGDDHFGVEVCRRVEPDISLNWYTGWPEFIKQAKFSMRWEGRLVPPETGSYRLRLKNFGPRDLRIDGKPVKFVYSSVEGVTEPIQLEAGHAYAFSFATSNSVLGAFRAQLYWKTPSMQAAEKVAQERPRTRPVYLPAGARWFDFWTGTAYEGGRTIETAAPIETMPLFVRAGSILPLGPAVQYAAENPAGPLEIRIYPGADGAFTLYDDEGDNYDYEKGVHATVRLVWNDAERRLTIGSRTGSYPGMPEEKPFRLVLVGRGHGVGPEVAETADQTIIYRGRAETAQF